MKFTVLKRKLGKKYAKRQENNDACYRDRIGQKTVKELCEYALEEIKNDIPSLVNYAVNKILAQKMLEKPSKKIAKKIAKKSK